MPINLCCCTCPPKKPTPPPMAPPEKFTFRNLTTKPITLNLVEHFAAPGSKPATIVIKNVQDIGKLAKGLGGLILGKKTQPDVQEIAAGSASFATRNLDITIQPFQTVESDVKVKERKEEEQLRLTFTQRDPDAKFRIEVLTSRAGIVSSTATGLSNVGDKRISVSFSQGKSHIAFYSTAQLDRWQSKLLDRTSLSSLSMPGTHNSPCCHIALPSVRCQAVGITEQLRHGVRFFDLRAQPDGNDLLLVHSVFPIALGGKKYLRDVFIEFYKFLDEHKSEVLIVSLKREGPGNATDQQFSKILHDHFINKEKNRWFTTPRIPNLGEARGKCVLLRRFGLDGSIKDWGINGENWADNTPDATTRSGDIRVQDFYEVKDTLNIDKKTQYIKDHLSRSASQISKLDGTPTLSQGGKFPLFVNFLSASNFWSVDTWPDRIAAKINPKIEEYLQVEHARGGLEKGDGGTGILVCDFVGEDGKWTLVELTVAMNSKLELREMGLK